MRRVRPDPELLGLGRSCAISVLGLALGQAPQRFLFIIYHYAVLSHVALTLKRDNKYLPPSYRRGKV